MKNIFHTNDVHSCIRCATSRAWFHKSCTVLINPTTINNVEQLDWNWWDTQLQMISYKWPGYYKYDCFAQLHIPFRSSGHLQKSGLLHFFTAQSLQWSDAMCLICPQRYWHKWKTFTTRARCYVSHKHPNLLKSMIHHHINSHALYAAHTPNAVNISHMDIPQESWRFMYVLQQMRCYMAPLSRKIMSCIANISNNSTKPPKLKSKLTFWFSVMHEWAHNEAKVLPHQNEPHSHSNNKVTNYMLTIW